MRREIDFTVTADGRDKGKTFHIVEAPAAQVEWWAVRAFSALEKAGVDVGAYAERGVQGLIVLGVRGLALLPPQDLKPLLDEMFACVTSVKPDPRNPQVQRPIVNVGSDSDDIEEFATRFTLRQQIAELHVGFFVGRRPIELGELFDDDDIAGLVEYPNVPRPLATAVSFGKATLAELNSTLSTRDLYDILEIVTVDSYNRRLIEKAHAAKRPKD